MVFITAFLQFAPSGYKVSAFRYILKVNYIEELDSCLDAIQDKLLDGKETIVVDSKNLQIEIPLRDILYVEGTPYRRVLLHTTEAASPVLECRGKMNDYTERLSGKGFIRLQKSFLVNMSYISKISGYTAQLRNGEILKVSEKDYKAICAGVPSYIRYGFIPVYTGDYIRRCRNGFGSYSPGCFVEGSGDSMRREYLCM